MAVDYSKWIVDYTEGDTIPAENQNTSVGSVFSSTFADIINNGYFDNGVPTDAVYAVASESTRFANSQYNFTLSSNGYTGFTSGNPQTFKLTLKKAPVRQANLYLSWGETSTTVSTAGAGDAPLTGDQSKEWVAPENASFLSVAPTSRRVTLGNTLGRKPFENILLAVYVQVVVLPWFGKYSDTSHQGIGGPYIYPLNEVDTVYPGILDNKFCRFTDNSGNDKVAIIIDVIVRTFVFATTTWIVRTVAPYYVFNKDGQTFVHQTSSTSTTRYTTVGISGIHAVATYDDMSIPRYGATTNYAAQPTSYAGFMVKQENYPSPYESRTYNLMDDSKTAVIPQLSVDFIEFDIDFYSSDTSFNMVCETDDLTSPNIVVYNRGAPVPYQNASWYVFYPWGRTQIENYVSSFGCYWTGDIGYGSNPPQNTTIADMINSYDMDIRLGIITEAGYTTGEYIQATGINDGIQTEWGEISDSPVTPIDTSQAPERGDDDSGDIDLGIMPYGGIANRFISTYALTDGELAQLGTHLWSELATQYFANFYLSNGTDYSISYADILNFFISCKYWPVKKSLIANIATQASASGVAVGTGTARISIGGNTPLVMTETAFTYDAGQITVPAKYGDFYDNEPYLKAQLYVPFCGSADIPPSLLIGAPVRLYYAFDILTGNVSAFLYKQYPVRYPLAMVNGNVGIDMQMSGSNNSAIANKLISSQIKNGMSALTGLVFGGASGGANALGSAVGSFGKAIASEYTELATSKFDNQLKPMVAGTSGDMSSLLQPMQAFIQLRRTNYHNAPGYAHTVGYKSEKSAVLSSLTGFTVCKNPDMTGIPGATESEINEIKQLLESGVYL